MIRVIKKAIFIINRFFGFVKSGIKKLLSKPIISTCSFILICLTICSFLVTIDIIPASLCWFNDSKDLRSAFFGAIVTISVLSLTMLSIVINNSKSYLGIEYQKYISFKSFPVKYKELLLLSFCTILVALLMYVFESNFMISLLLLDIIGIFLVYSLSFFRYLLVDKAIRRFLLKKQVLMENGAIIFAGVYSFYNGGFTKRSLDENKDILNFIKEAKKVIYHG